VTVFDLNWVIQKYPDKEELLRKLGHDEDFVELCEHYKMMLDAIGESEDPIRTRYQQLANELKAELMQYLDHNQTKQPKS
jgi:hypothetical protein